MNIFLRLNVERVKKVVKAKSSSSAKSSVGNECLTNLNYVRYNTTGFNKIASGFSKKKCL